MNETVGQEAGECPSYDANQIEGRVPLMHIIFTGLAACSPKGRPKGSTNIGYTT
jgi:hypothetical protein